jgi:hypothetical protein
LKDCVGANPREVCNEQGRPVATTRTFTKPPASRERREPGAPPVISLARAARRFRARRIRSLGQTNG